MNQQNVIKTLREHLPELETTFGVRELSLFGSVATDEAGPKSDVDVLVSFGAPPSFRQYMNTLLYLEDVLGCKVDLVTEGTLKSELLPVVEKDLFSISHGA